MEDPWQSSGEPKRSERAVRPARGVTGLRELILAALALVKRAACGRAGSETASPRSSLAADAPRRWHFPQLTLPKSARERGIFGEDLGERCLRSAGLELLERNCRLGSDELDRVMRDGDSLVIVEVKTRRSLRGGRPAESVGARKRRRLRRALARLVQGRPAAPRRRIDLVEVFPAEPPETGLWLVWTPHAIPVEAER